jgi:hypothetical protein
MNQAESEWRIVQLQLELPKEGLRFFAAQRMTGMNWNHGTH